MNAARRAGGRKSSADAAAPQTLNPNMPLYLVHGNDEYYVKQKAAQILSALCPEEDRALRTEVIDGSVDKSADALLVLQQCRDALSTVGLLGGGRIVWLKDATFLPGTKTGQAQDVKEGIVKFCDVLEKGLPPGQQFLVSSRSVHEGSSFFKHCKALGQVFSFKRQEKSYAANREALTLLQQLLAKAHLRMEGNARDLFILRVGTDTRQIIQEFEKLKLFLGEKAAVTEADIRAIVTTSRDAMAWDAADAMLNGNPAEAIALSRRMMLQKGGSAIPFFTTLEQKLADMQVLHECMGRGWLSVEVKGGWKSARWNEDSHAEEFMSKLKGKKTVRQWPPYRLAEACLQVRRFKAGQLREFQEKTLRAHEMLVSSPVSPGIIMETLIIDLARSLPFTGNRRV